MRLRVFSLTLVVAAFFFIPLIAAAQGFPFFGPIINQNWTDTGGACPLGWGAVIVVINNIIKLAITLLVMFVAPLMLAYAGFLLVAYSVNPAGKERARQVITSLIIGLVIALAAWMIVNAIMVALVDRSALGNRSWFDIVTTGSASPCLSTTTRPLTNPPPSSIQPTPGCPTCVSLAAQGILCKDLSSCTAVPAVATKLSNLAGRAIGWRVTEAFPPTVTHTAACHNNGTCVDAGFGTPSQYTTASVMSFMDAATQVGFRAVFETESCTLRDSIRAQFGSSSAYCRSDNGFSHITGNHFSLYNN